MFSSCLLPKNKTTVIHFNGGCGRISLIVTFCNIFFKVLRFIGAASIIIAHLRHCPFQKLLASSVPSTEIMHYRLLSMAASKKSRGGKGNVNYFRLWASGICLLFYKLIQGGWEAWAFRSYDQSLEEAKEVYKRGSGLDGWGRFILYLFESRWWGQLRCCRSRYSNAQKNNNLLAKSLLLLSKSSLCSLHKGLIITMALCQYYIVGIACLIWTILFRLRIYASAGKLYLIRNKTKRTLRNCEVWAKRDIVIYSSWSQKVSLTSENDGQVFKVNANIWGPKCTVYRRVQSSIIGPTHRVISTPSRSLFLSRSNLRGVNSFIYPYALNHY